MIRIETVHLTNLLVDLAYTADIGTGPAAGILLHTDRGPIGDEPGDQDLLVGTSTNRFAVGHAYAPSYGQHPGPMLWPLADAQAVVSAFKPKLKADKEHAVEIRQQGAEIIVCEDPDLFGDGLRLQFTAGQASKFPPGLWRALSTVPTARDENGPSEPRTDFAPGLLDPFIRVARRRNEPIEMYRYHHRTRLLVQIGDRYRGSLHTAQTWTTSTPAAGGEPRSDVYEPELPDDDGED